MSYRTADHVERVPRPSRADLERLILEQRPVIITDLFHGQPIRDVASEAEAVARWGDLRLTFRPEYTYNDFEIHRAGRNARTREMTLADYARFDPREAAAPLLCVEELTPPAILAMLDLGDYPEINAADGDRIVSRVFAGKAGNHANLHYDRDYHPTLLHQLYGRKRVLVISPRESQKLRPVTNFSEYLLPNFTAEHREAFVRYANAYDCVLDAGETLLIPAAFWHHVEYVTDSMSLNFRLKRNRYVQLLGSGIFHSNYFVQGVVTKLVDAATAEGYAGAFERLLAIYTDRALGPYEKFDAIDALFRELYATACADFPQRRYFASMTGLRESELWRERLDDGTLYGDALTAGAADAARSR